MKRRGVVTAAYHRGPGSGKAALAPRNLIFSARNPATYTALVMQKFLEYLELNLTIAGVLVIAIFFAVFRNIAPWKAAALAALAVGVLHGTIFFIVRSTQRRARNRAVQAIRHTLDDLIRNKLQVVLFATEIQDQDWRPAAQRAVQEIQNSLNEIEKESFRALDADALMK
jgi:c-di-AMP phosphodiesterase-like protein